MKLSVVALVVIFATVAYASDQRDLDALNAAVQRLRALKQRQRGFWFWGGSDKKLRCDTSTNKALTNAYNNLCKSKFSTYTEGIKTASAFLQAKCSKLNNECCTNEEGCKDDEIKECCPTKVEEKEED
ncbi:PREDICTED: uncharacterized protein LOC109479066 [Branchiostoma belcheri]|uniref:Uncharacterized protein LOC109479066 n=1 Tax=Branchiostoma belcheri TaxID=7741 RepID=A0A6P4ZZW7_BRABE|nr:PREDICTED: uncharacterized protein LOC109479066 [Branchiostoma belcheri]XP_019636502.1 PREDICTED: uncharacterized protein LOC109479066 [Branchiostoma belcheri]XP_019636503.1 PREDICTED: uncharacterized protein LOC109479066 [Branchiostoma belcheri]